MSGNEDIFGFGRDPSEFEQVEPKLPEGANTYECKYCNMSGLKNLQAHLNECQIRKVLDEVGADGCSCGAYAPSGSRIHSLDCAKVDRWSAPSAFAQVAKDMALHRRRTRPHKTFRVSQVNPRTNAATEMEPWNRGTISELRGELLLAYRMMALLVENSSGARFDASDVRRMTGLEPMMTDLAMKFTKDETGAQVVYLDVHPIDPGDIDL